MRPGQILRLALVAVVSCGTGAELANGNSAVWSRLPDLPVGVAGHATFAGDDGTLHVVGGTSWIDGVKVIQKCTWWLRPGGDAWQAGAPLLHPRAYAAVLPRDGGAWLVGGHDEANARSDAVAILDGETMSLPALPAPRCYAGGGVEGKTACVFGGVADPGDLATQSAHLWTLHWQDGPAAWIPAPPYPAGPVFHPAMATVDGRVYVFTGGWYDGDTKAVCNRDDAAFFEPETERWRLIRRYPFAARGVAAVALGRNAVLLVGGHRAAATESRMTNEAFIYLVDEDRYAPAPPLPVAAMNLGLAVHDGWVYAVGGENAPRRRSSAAFVAALDTILQNNNDAP